MRCVSRKSYWSWKRKKEKKKREIKKEKSLRLTQAHKHSYLCNLIRTKDNASAARSDRSDVSAGWANEWRKWSASSYPLSQRCRLIEKKGSLNRPSEGICCFVFCGKRARRSSRSSLHWQADKLAMGKCGSGLLVLEEHFPFCSLPRKSDL